MPANNTEVREVPPPPYNPYEVSSTITRSPYIPTRVDVKEHYISEVSPYQLENQSSQSYPHNSRHEFQPPSTTTTATLPAHPPINTKKKTCFERYCSAVINPNSWASCFYFLIVSPLISFFAFFWVLLTLLAGIISLMCPPIGFFLCIVFVWSWRALGRLELLSVRICTFYKPHPSTKRRQFHQIITIPNTNSLLQYGRKLFSDGYTWSCFKYFIFVKFFLMLVTWVTVLVLFILAFTPLMLFTMPLMCNVCKKLGKWEVELVERFLLINSEQ